VLLVTQMSWKYWDLLLGVRKAAWNNYWKNIQSIDMQTHAWPTIDYTQNLHLISLLPLANA